MKIIKKFILFFIVLISLFNIACQSSSCGRDWRWAQKPGPPVSKYAPEEHIERITALLKSKHKVELKNEEILSMTVNNVYHFNDTYPWLFVVDYIWRDYNSLFEYRKAKIPENEIPEGVAYYHAIGHIEWRDETYSIEEVYGPSYYSVSGAIERKDKLYYSPGHYDLEVKNEERDSVWAPRIYAYEENGLIHSAYYNIFSPKIFNGEIADNKDALYISMNYYEYDISRYGKSGSFKTKLK